MRASLFVAPHQARSNATTYLTTYELIAGGTQRYWAVPAVRGSGADTRI